MTALITLLLTSGILAGLIQYFVDFKGLPIYVPKNSNESFADNKPPDAWDRMLNFLKRNWQFFGYLTVGIAGALLVPVIDQLLHLKGISEYLACLKNAKSDFCINNDWNLLIIFGYGIISGYSSVRIIRGFGSFILGNIGKDLEEQKEALKKTQEEIAALKKKITAAEKDNETSPLATTQLHEGIVEYGDFCDACENELTMEAAASLTCEQFPKPWIGKKWRVAESLKTLLSEVNKLAPARSKKSDGTVGDIVHAQGNSDHNPWVKDVIPSQGIVTALDITHDPSKGCDCNAIAQFMYEKKDNRVKYVIWNNRIMNSRDIDGNDAWTWRTYSGKNPHDKHIHISVLCERNYCDDNKEWSLNF